MSEGTYWCLWVPTCVCECLRVPTGVFECLLVRSTLLGGMLVSVGAYWCLRGSTGV